MVGQVVHSCLEVRMFRPFHQHHLLNLHIRGSSISLAHPILFICRSQSGRLLKISPATLDRVNLAWMKIQVQDKPPLPHEIEVNYHLDWYFFTHNLIFSTNRGATEGQS